MARPDLQTSNVVKNYSGISYNYIKSEFTMTAGQVTGTVSIRSLGTV